MDPRELTNRRILAEQAKSQKVSALEEQRVLAEDPNAFKYDEVMDEIEEQKKQQSFIRPGGPAEAKGTSKPKYVHNLMQMASERKAEQERVMLRKIQRERAQDVEDHGDKEEFVTAAYKEKLLEQQRLAEAEKDKIAAEDVTKKKDMSGFYNNLLFNNEALGTASKKAAAAPAAAPPPPAEPPAKKLKLDEAPPAAPAAIVESAIPAPERPAPTVPSEEPVVVVTAAVPNKEVYGAVAAQTTAEERADKAKAARERLEARKRQQQ